MKNNHCSFCYWCHFSFYNNSLQCQSCKPKENPQHFGSEVQESHTSCYLMRCRRKSDRTYKTGLKHFNNKLGPTPNVKEEPIKSSAHLSRDWGQIIIVAEWCCLFLWEIKTLSETGHSWRHNGNHTLLQVLATFPQPPNHNIQLHRQMRLSVVKQRFNPGHQGSL